MTFVYHRLTFTDIDECFNNPCLNGAYGCRNTFGSYECICAPNFTGIHCQIGGFFLCVNRNIFTYDNLRKNNNALSMCLLINNFPPRYSYSLLYMLQSVDVALLRLWLFLREPLLVTN